MRERSSKTRIFGEIKSGIWLSVATCFMLFLYAPLELLFTNQDEFWFDAYILVPIMLVVFVIVCIVSVLACMLLVKLGNKAYQVGLALYFAAFIGLYIQGNFLTAGLPPLDGETIDWSRYTDERIKSLVLWVIAAAVVAVFFRKLKRQTFETLVKVVSICMTLMLGVTLLTLALTNQGFEKKPSLSITTENMFQMSQDTNFIILLLDAVDGQAVSDMLKSNPEYQDIFTDFTYYDNVMAAYPYTKHSIPFILSGQWFENETEFVDYEIAAYAASPFFASMEEREYRMGVYEAELLLNDDGLGRFENVLPNARDVADKWAFARWQVIMTGFKYAPYDLKRFCFVNPNAFNELKITPEGRTLFTPSNSDFYRSVLDEEIDYTDRKCFKFIHLDGGHLPFIYDENVNVIENGTYEGNLQACMTLTGAYLDKLKDAGVYDNSVIIVMADHGFAWEDIHDRQNPILFVKGIDEEHEFSVADAPISFVDLQEAYQRLLSGTDGEAIFDWQSGDSRERRFLFHEYLNEDYMVEYMQTGPAHDKNTMYETGNVYSR